METLCVFSKLRVKKLKTVHPHSGWRDQIANKGVGECTDIRAFSVCCNNINDQNGSERQPPTAYPMAHEPEGCMSGFVLTTRCTDLPFSRFLEAQVSISGCMMGAQPRNECRKSVVSYRASAASKKTLLTCCPCRRAR